MDVTSARLLVAARLDQLDAADVDDEASARQALEHVVVAVGGMNAVLGAQSPTAGIGSPIESILDKLEDWIRRLVDGLTKIVKKLGEGATFSISFGTGVSATVNFGPLSTSS